MTHQEAQKRRVRATLERIWRNHQARVRNAGHELVVLAVPTYPADIEAVSAMDMQDVADLLAAFAEHRKEKPNELHAIKPPAGETQRTNWESLDEGVGERQSAGHGPEPLGQGDDGGGTPQERAEPTAEPAESDAAPDTVELMPVFELQNGEMHIRIWANGDVDGFFDGTLINRLPQMLHPPLVAKLEDAEMYRVCAEGIGDVAYITHLPTAKP